MSLLIFSIISFVHYTSYSSTTISYVRHVVNVLYLACSIAPLVFIYCFTLNIISIRISKKKVLCSLTIQNLFLKVFWDLSVYYAELSKMVSQHLKTSWYVISEVRSSQFFVTWTRLCNIVSTSKSLNKH